MCGTLAAGAAEVQTHRSAGQFDPAVYAADQQRLLAWLESEQVTEGLAAPLSIALDDREIRAIERGFEEGSQAVPSALLAGIVKPATLIFNLVSPSHGAFASTADGGLVWTAGVQSSNAAGLRVHFEGFALPPGYELWLYSTGGVARGPYTGRGPNGSGDFWSNTVSGPDAVLQVRGLGAAALDQIAEFTVTEVGHVGHGAALKSFCSFNAECIENGECFNVAAVNDAKDAIAHMQYVKRPYIYFCSGGLLNDSAASETPYFLTANHCISRDREAATLEAFFQFTIPCGSTACPSYNQISSPSTIGSSVLATNRTSDFTLLLLAEPAPAGSAFLGWTDAPVVDTDADLYRISHPGGAPQAYSRHKEWVPPVECSSWPRGSWIYSQDQVGATEGGSSGSPVVNGQGQVVGQLSGGCGFNVNDNCDNVNNSTVDGAFAAYYTQVAPWLGGGGGGCDDADGDGYDDEACGGTDCNDADPNVHPGATEVCGDLVDNNCDGTIDEGCGGSCLPAGDPCSLGSDCCSGICHPKKHTCK
ncbi:MAG: MopE-related protein [Thermoanaerobaculales bacterium]|nr:MopE-related protein [Thermoanaerobaculales bacterium]